MKLALLWCPLLAAALFAGGCQRVQRLVGPDPIRIGVAMPSPGGGADGASLLYGAQYAAQELNAAGGVLGRRVEIVSAAAPPGAAASTRSESDRLSATVGRQQADALARYAPLAVIGHDVPAAAGAASELYAARNILFLATYETDQTSDGTADGLVFNLQVPTVAVYDAMGQMARQEGFCRLLLFRERTELGRQHSLVFKQYAQDMGLTVVAESTFERGTPSFLPILVKMLSRPDVDMNAVDAAVFIGLSDAAAKFLADGSELGRAVPVLLPWFSTTLASLRNLAPPALRRVRAQALFGLQQPSPVAAAMSRQFTEQYKRPMLRDALLAYDAVRVLALAAGHVRSADARAVAGGLRALRFSPAPYLGMTGPVSFNERGQRLESVINTVQPRIADQAVADIQQSRRAVGAQDTASMVRVIHTYRDTGNPGETLETMRRVQTSACIPR